MTCRSHDRRRALPGRIRNECCVLLFTRHAPNSYLCCTLGASGSEFKSVKCRVHVKQQKQVCVNASSVECVFVCCKFDASGVEFFILLPFWSIRCGNHHSFSLLPVYVSSVAFAILCMFAHRRWASAREIETTSNKQQQAQGECLQIWQLAEGGLLLDTRTD
jgi:hypothetical protein